MNKTDKISKDGNRVVVTEYESREIDQYGDVVNVNHWPTKAQAIDAAQKLIESGSVAAVVEKHVSRYPAFLFKEPNTYRTIATYGSAEALEAGGWSKD